MTLAENRGGTKRFHVPLWRPATTLVGIIRTALFGHAVLVERSLGAVVSAVFLGMVVGGLAPELEITVGRDGVRLKDRLRDRFVPYGELAAVEKTPGGALLLLRGGKHLRLRGDAPRRRADSAVENPIFDAVSAAFQARETGDEVETALLARGGRAPRAWLDEARALLRGGPSYRANAADPDALLRVVVDAGTARRAGQRAPRACRLARARRDDAPPRLRARGSRAPAHRRRRDEAGRGRRGAGPTVERAGAPNAVAGAGSSTAHVGHEHPIGHLVASAF